MENISNNTASITVSGRPWKFCPECGKKLEADWKYCAACGKAVNSERVAISYPFHPYDIPFPASPGHTYTSDPFRMPGQPIITCGLHTQSTQSTASGPDGTRAATP